MKYVQRIALFIFFFSINFEVWDPLGTNGSFSVSKFTGYCYLFVMLPLIIRFTTNKELKPVLYSILAFFGLLTIVSLVNIKYPFYSFFDFTILQNIILFWILVNHEEHDPYVLEKGFISFAIGSVLLAFLYYLGIGIEYEGGRVRIFGDNQNIIGLRMGISIVIIFLTLMQNRLHFGDSRYLLLLPVPLMLLLLMQTGSRVAFISFLLSFIVLVLVVKTKRIWNKIILMVFGSFALIYFWLLLLKEESMRLRLLESFQEGDLSGRDVIWSKIFPLIKNNLIFGVGRTGYSSFADTAFGYTYSPHNVILEVLSLTGITGLILYGYFLYQIVRKSIYSYKTEGILLPFILLIPVLGMLLSAQLLEVKIGWIIFAYAMGTSLGIKAIGIKK